MAKIETTKWDIADHLNSSEDIANILDAALEDGDVAEIAEILGAVARSRGMTALARKTGITREGLYKSLSANGNPSFSTIVRTLKYLGFELRVATIRPQLEPA